MLIPYILATGLAATAAQAFLLPPKLTTADIDSVESFPLLAEVSHVDVPLECPGCDIVIQSPHGFSKIDGHVDSHLELNFTIEHNKNVDDRLLLNDFELYPSQDVFNSALGAVHVPDIPGSPRKLKTVKSHLGYALATTVGAPDADGAELVQLDFQIIEVRGRFVSSVPSLTLRLIKKGGDLYILNIEKKESETSQPQTPSKTAECKTMICRWKAFVNELAHIKPFKHCKGKMHHKGHKGPHAHNKGHHQHPSGGRLTMNAHHHTWLQLAKNVASHILLPALIGIFIGIVVGIIASLIGMMVSKLVVYLWRSFFRGRTSSRRHCHHRHGSGHASHRATRREDAVDEEKSGLLGHQEPLPLYRDEEEPTVDKN